MTLHLPYEKHFLNTLSNINGYMVDKKTIFVVNTSNIYVTQAKKDNSFSIPSFIEGEFLNIVVVKTAKSNVYIFYTYGSDKEVVKKTILDFMNDFNLLETDNVDNVTIVNHISFSEV